MRTALAGVAVVLAAAWGLTGCSNASACVDDVNSSAACPPLEGSYQMSYGTETDSSECAAGSVGPDKPNPLVLTRAGSVLRTTVGGVQYSGQVSDTFDFTLDGDNGLDPDAGQLILSVHGKYVPGAADAGTINGTWSTTDGDSCNRSTHFDGTKLQ